jgi:hypothetical protein
MDKTIEILKQYRQADSYERTCLFLQFPDLRDVFQDIELKNPAVEKDRTIFNWLNI